MRPDWLHTSTTADQVDVLAILVQAVDADQRHAGILHRTDGGALLLLDLQWHHRLRNAPPTGPYVWVRPSIEPEFTCSIAALCRLIWKRHQAGGIPYGFNYENACFDRRTGDVLFGDSEHGLTCATFILAVFQSLGIRLVATETWPHREDDARWQQKVIEHVRKGPSGDRHAALLEKDLGCTRYRPEEVAGAAACPVLPARFEQALAAAQEICSALSGA